MYLCLQLLRQTSQVSFNRRTMGLRLTPDLLSFASRSVLVRSSFVSRSSLVRYSLVYRRPNEDRTRNKQKTNERATNIDRDADEKLSATRRVATVMVGRIPFCNHRTAYCPSPYSCRGTFSPTLDILTANQGFPTHSAHSLSQSPQKPLTSSKKPSLQQTQQPPKTHRPTQFKPLTTARQPNPL